MDLSTADSMVLDALTRAASQHVSELKPAEAQLAQWETNPGYYSALLRVISNHSLEPTVRCLAAMTLKNGVDKYWRDSAPNAISKEEKAALRLGLLDTLKEPVNQIAVQIAVSISKAARIDCPNEWPDLIPTLVNIIAANPDLLVQHRAYLILYHVIKTLASKRLPGDRRNFQEQSSLLYTYFLGFHNSLMDTFFSQFQKGDPLCQGTLERALFTLRILRKCTIYGFKVPRESEQVILFVSSVFDRAKNMLLVRKQANANSSLFTLSEKVISQLMKVPLSLLENHPFSFLPFLQPSLAFSVSLLFTAEVEGLLFEMFVVQCLNLVKGVLQCAEYKLAKGTTEEENRPEAVQATRIKQEFFQAHVLKEICQKLITHYFLLSVDELESWDSDPESYVIEEESESWKYNMRPCTESLFIALFRAYHETLTPILLELGYSNHQPVNPTDLPAVLRKDAVYLAIGLSAFDLYDEIDMDKWFQTLIQELAVKDANYRIIRRRAAWLLARWSGVRLSQEVRPEIYRALIPLLQGDEDFAVRLTAANALKVMVDDFEFDPEKFVEFLQPTFSLLFNLLKEAKECDTKMHILTVMSVIIERMGVTMKPYCSAFSQYVPLLWEGSGDHNMLRCAIVSTLVHLVRSFLADELMFFLYQVIAYAVDTNQEAHVYMLEDGLSLWLAVVANASVLSPELLHLIKMLPPILDMTTEYLQDCSQLIQAYILLSPLDFMQQGENVFLSCHSLVNEVNTDGLVAILPAIEIAVFADPVRAIPLCTPILHDVFRRVHSGCGLPMLMGHMLSILSRVLLHSRDVFCQITESVSNELKESAEATLSQILFSWLDRMPLVVAYEKRKLLSLALISLINAHSPVVRNRMPALLSNVTQTLNDIVDFDDDSKGVDSLLLVKADGMDDLTIPDLFLETEHERRIKKFANGDPVYNIDLRQYFQREMIQFKSEVDSKAFEEILMAMDKLSRESFITFIDLHPKV